MERSFCLLYNDGVGKCFVKDLKCEIGCISWRMRRIGKRLCEKYSQKYICAFLVKSFKYIETASSSSWKERRFQIYKRLQALENSKLS